MSGLYPELAGKTISAEALMEYIFAKHEHPASPDGYPFLWSLDLERWLRETAS